MNTIEALRAELLANAAVVAKVQQRVYPMRAEHNCSQPYIVMRLISDVPEQSLDGTPQTRLVNARVQIDCYGERYDEVHALAVEVDKTIGGLARADLSAVRLSLSDEFDDADKLVGVSMDFSVWR